MVFQNYALYPHMKVYENLAFGLKLAGMPKAEIDQRVREAAELLEMGHLLDRYPRQLSGGQAQRVAVGRAIVKKPECLPLRRAAVQPGCQAARQHARAPDRTAPDAARQRPPATVVYVTHDQVEAMTMGERICVLKDGRIQQLDTPTALYAAAGQCLCGRLHRQPRDEPAARWTCAARGGEARAAGARARCRCRPPWPHGWRCRRRARCSWA
jgi:oligogalacturonide transport system ATP-binding protein